MGRKELSPHFSIKDSVHSHDDLINLYPLGPTSLEVPLYASSARGCMTLGYSPSSWESHGETNACLLLPCFKIKYTLGLYPRKMAPTTFMLGSHTSINIMKISPHPPQTCIDTSTGQSVLDNFFRSLCSQVMADCAKSTAETNHHILTMS